MPIEIEPKIEDYTKFAMIMFTKERTYKMSVLMQRISLPIVAMLLVLMAKPIKYTHVGIATALSLAWFFLEPKLFNSNLKKKFRNAYQKAALNQTDFLKPYTIDKIPGGLVAKRGNEEYEVLYDMLDFYYTDEEHIYILGGGFDFIIPRTAFDNSETFENMKEVIDRQIQIARNRK